MGKRKTSKKPYFKSHQRYQFLFAKMEMKMKIRKDAGVAGVAGVVVDDVGSVYFCWC